MSIPGKHAVMEQILAEGLKHVFGNPGYWPEAFGLGVRPDSRTQSREAGQTTAG